jgi:hypothetical protein
MDEECLWVLTGWRQLTFKLVASLTKFLKEDITGRIHFSNKTILIHSTKLKALLASNKASETISRLKDEPDKPT